MAKTAEMTPMKNKVRMSYICVMAATDTTKQGISSEGIDFGLVNILAWSLDE